MIDSHIIAFFCGFVVGAGGVFAALWFDIGIDYVSSIVKRILKTHPKQGGI